MAIVLEYTGAALSPTGQAEVRLLRVRTYSRALTQEEALLDYQRSLFAQLFEHETVFVGPDTQVTVSKAGLRVRDEWMPSTQNAEG